MHRLLCLALLLSATSVDTSAQDPRAVPSLGVLLLAHGGSDEWNRAIEAAARPLAARLPTEIAFGMAEPAGIAAALHALEARGVERVAVVRLFLSGASFRDGTEYLLGLRQEPPPVLVGAHSREPAGAHGVPETPAAPLDHGMDVGTHHDGIVESGEAARALSARAASVSLEPTRETVLLLAHGMGGAGENEDLLTAMRGIEGEVRSLGFRRVRSATLREDWPEARAAAEREIRDFVRAELEAGRKVLVVPVRVSGFGPYADVLAGLDYVATEGLLPGAEVSAWLARKVREIAADRGWSDTSAADRTRP